MVSIKFAKIIATENYEQDTNYNTDVKALSIINYIYQVQKVK